MLNCEVTCQVISHVGTSTQSHKCFGATHAREGGQTSLCPILGYHHCSKLNQSNQQMTCDWGAYKRGIHAEIRYVLS
jgi:hypothetical protein